MAQLLSPGKEKAMNFAQAARNAGSFTTTENGAVALNTTGNGLLDLFGSIGALRNTTEERVETLFAEAYREDPLLATKIVFYARDVRGGLGERQTFRTIICYMAEHHPEALLANLDLIGVYGRYDDLYSLIGTPLEDAMWAAMKAQFEEDLKNLHEDKAISLLAKWIKTPDASSENTRKLGILTAHKLGYQVYNFKRILRAMRKKIGVIESLMSQGKWDEIEYSAVPSRAMLLYRNAFGKHDSDRYKDYIDQANQGTVKINSSTLYPYDLVERSVESYWRNSFKTDSTIEAQWKQLPNYVEPGTNALVIADTSGSMQGRPLSTALGLAVYFAERNVGAYHNMWMSFSAHPEIQLIKGETLQQKLASIDMGKWGMNTDLKAAFERVLEIAIKGAVPADEMPKSLIVISDMEIDACGNRQWTFYEAMKAKFAEAGYTIPNIIFWNVNSRHDVFHADANRTGVQLVSGSSTSTFKNVMHCIGMTPMEAMHYIIDSERYEAITLAS